ncbi:MAG: hypothetical protein F4112_17180 [Holophagales bacterium]|nr:hypothetical protein [Holophagales bacterium]MYD24164.1 hypothetical protein [Holophagales bacterium]MYI34678.1 hypothetical protein [Holophagales bacterium]
MPRAFSLALAFSLAMCTNGEEAETKPTTINIVSPDDPDTTRHLPITNRVELGTWRTVYLGIEIQTTLYEEHGKPMLHQQFEDGSHLSLQLTNRNDNYYLPDGEWLVITPNGDLKLYDAAGLIWLASPTSSSISGAGQATEKAAPQRSDSLGTWRTSYMGINITTTIYATNNSDTYLMEQYAVHRGSGDKIEDTLAKRGDRYWTANGSIYYEISRGRLDAYYSDGEFIWSAR